MITIHKHRGEAALILRIRAKKADRYNWFEILIFKNSEDGWWGVVVVVVGGGGGGGVGGGGNKKNKLKNLPAHFFC